MVIGVGDDRPTSEFDGKMREEREAYSTDQARSTMLEALALCARKKAHSQAHTLIIGAELLVAALPQPRWLEALPDLVAPVANMRFSEIYLVGRADDDNVCLKLKWDAETACWRGERGE